MPKQKQEVVSWTAGYRARISATVAHNEIQKLEKRLGRYPQPKDILQAARKPKHPLHSAFDWDDAEAAQQYRLGQARGMIRSLRITVVHGQREETTVTAVHVPRTGYRPIAEVAANPLMMNEVLKTVRSALRSWRERYARIQGATELLDALEEVLKKTT